MTKSLMVFVTVAIVGGVVTSVAQADHPMNTAQFRTTAPHGFNDGTVLPIDNIDLPGAPEAAPHPDLGSYDLLTGGNVASNPNLGDTPEFGRGIDRIFHRQPNPWPGRQGVAGFVTEAGLRERPMDLVTLGTDVDDPSKGTSSNTTFLNWNYPGNWVWNDYTKYATPALDFGVRGPDGRLPADHDGEISADGVRNFPEFQKTDELDLPYRGADSYTLEQKSRINSGGAAWASYRMGLYNLMTDWIWGQVWYEGRPGQLDEFFIDGGWNGSTDNHLYDGIITSLTFEDMLQIQAARYPGLDLYAEDQEEPGVRNQWMTYRITGEPTEGTLYDGTVRVNDDGSETPLNRLRSLYMTANPDGFVFNEDNPDDGSWGLDGVAYLVGQGAAATGGGPHHGSGFSAVRSTSSDIDHAYQLFEFGDGHSAAHPPIPEPATLGLILLGGLLALRRRRA